MKTIKTVVVALALGIGALAFAGEKPAKNEKNATVGEMISQLISNPEVELNGDVNAYVEFHINDENRIIVTSVDTNDYFLKRYIKTQLNHEKIGDAIVDSKKTYRVLFKFTELQ